uniref:Mucosa-associated lymphoid tissue lymphoma translocation protein 1 n=1 Tax=Homalodisca liturata TaxID=320908 RepID=A0A1B6HII0_9HEMI
MMMEERLLEDVLSVHLRRELVRSLNTNDKWNRIIDGLRTYRIPVFLNVDRMNDMMARGMNPANWVLEELFDRMCSFDEFCVMLREFDLLEELTLLTPAEPMVIEVQPGNGEDVRIENGEVLQLTCIASGLPRPTYQWYRDNKLIPGQTSSLLSIPSFTEELRGVYYCVVKQEIRGHIATRNSIEVTVDRLSKRPILLSNLPRIRSVLRGQTLLLTVQAEGYPEPRYEWYRSPPRSEDAVNDCFMPNIVLDNETSNALEVKNIGSQDEGVYRCRVYNEAGETFSIKCNLSIFDRPPDYIASAKIALLIGNEDYRDRELQGLHAPSNDVATLAEILEDLGFHVIALQNLTYSEMSNAFKWFCRILPENAYAFFYFAGHGFSKLASKFMMPVDCPKDEIRLNDCLCDEQLTQILSQGNPLQLLVMLFDCCLIESRDLSIGRTEFEHDLGNCNIVLGTATRNHQNAYESNKDANGLFVNQLKSHLAEEVPVIEVLRANQREFREKQQQPTIFFSGADNCSLTDPVKDNPQLQEKLRSELNFQSYEQEIYFSKTNEHFKIHVSKHKNCFLNSIDLRFPDDFAYNFTVEVNPSDVKLKVRQRVVTVYNIQKVKSSLFVTVSINGLRRADDGFVAGPHDIYQFTVDCPIITKGQLWHQNNVESH